ncbi:MrpF/PhaF family protein [Streptomyces sp. NPDC059874]|uniref:MrpF/PhaF family protein n=1 Tax=Streptomyces sp. NPDC059874 TaxID=3346983 RepID=UPI003652DFA1
MSGAYGTDWNAWLVAAGVLLVLGLPPVLLTCGRGTPVDRLAGLAMTGTLVTVILLLAARGLGRTAYTDLGLALALLGPVGVLAFARFLGRPREGSARRTGAR